MRVRELLLTAALLDPCAAQSVLHNVRFKVHIVMENELLRRDNTSSCGEEPSSGAGTFVGACRSHLELGHLPAHAPYSGHLINVWNGGKADDAMHWGKWIHSAPVIPTHIGSYQPGVVVGLRMSMHYIAFSSKLIHYAND